MEDKLFLERLEKCRKLASDCIEQLDQMKQEPPKESAFEKWEHTQHDFSYGQTKERKQGWNAAIDEVLQIPLVNDSILSIPNKVKELKET